MGNLPRSAKIYLVLVCLIGLWAVIDTLVFPGVMNQSALAETPWEVLIFLVLPLMTRGRKISLLHSKNRNEDMSITYGFAITFTAILHLGPAFGVLLAVINSLVNGLLPWNKRQKAHQFWFNLALAVLSAKAGGAIFIGLNHASLSLSLLSTAPFAAVAACIIYFLVNSTGIAIIIALTSGKKLLPVWVNCLWPVTNSLATACLCVVCLILSSGYTAVALLLGLPMIVAAFQSYEIYSSRLVEREQRIKEQQTHHEEMQAAFLQTIQSLARAIDARDQNTHQHILRVQRHALAIARQLGITGDEYKGIEYGALLHDIGKIGVPDHILLKQGRLTDEEFAQIKEHPAIGANILADIDSPWQVLPIVRHHHEKWDGSGYPDKLQGEAIPLTARIMAVADVYDALTSDRPYRKSWTHERTIALIQEDSGVHFDPVVVEAFLCVVDTVVAEINAEEAALITAQAAPGYAASPDAAASGASRAIHAARDIGRASTEVLAVNLVMETLSPGLGVQEMLETLASKLTTMISGATCVFFLREHGRRGMCALAAIGPSQALFYEARTTGTFGQSESVAQSGQVYQGEYEPNDLDQPSSAEGIAAPLISLIIVPIRHQDSILGTINLYHPEPSAFRPPDVHLLETVGKRIGEPVYNGLLHERMHRHPVTDALTGLYNSRYLSSYLDERCLQIEGEEPPPFALLCLNVEGLKEINEHFGFAKGDAALCELSRRFRAALQPDDLVARYAGDEFFIVVTGADAASAAAMAASVRSAAEEYDPELMHPERSALRLGASIGYSCYPEDGKESPALLSIAEERMTSEKKLNRKEGIPILIENTSEQASDKAA